MKSHYGLYVHSKIPVTTQMIYTLSKTDLPIENIDAPIDFTGHNGYEKEPILQKWCQSQKLITSRPKSKDIACRHSQSRTQEYFTEVKHLTGYKYQRLPMYHTRNSMENAKMVNHRASRSPKHFVDVSTDTQELDIIRKTEEAQMRHKLYLLEQQLEIAEAQALVFHLSEQLHLARQNNIRAPEEIQPKEDGPFEINESKFGSQTFNRMPKMEYIYESSDVLSLDASLQSDPNYGSCKPVNLTANMVTLDNSWWIQWNKPISDSDLQNPIVGYALSIQDHEIKRINRPDFTKTILHLPSSTVYPVELCLQSITETGLCSKLATIELKASSSSECFDQT